MNYQKVSFEQAKHILDTQPDAVLFDVREEEEYNTGHAKGAQLFPVDTIGKDTAKEMVPRKDMPILVYCRSGARSKTAAQTLVSLGYTHVYDIGSLVGWRYGLEL